MPRKKAFRIGRSRTGFGLFATDVINKKKFIVEYKGRRLNNEQAEKLEARGNRYLYEINSRWTIDGTTRRNLGRYANHSCRPNAESHRLNGKVILRAIKTIRPGDEITYNYGSDYFKNVITASGCKCVKCREKRNAARRARARAAKRRAARAARKKNGNGSAMRT
jgi:SET domain-containing protein